MAVALIIIALVIILAIWFITLRNGIVEKNNRCDNALQTIDTQLQRRFDLIPNLVETVKGYAKHESGTLEAVTAARAAATSAQTTDERLAADSQLTAALRQLFAVSEACPDLKANANFQQLQSELADTENRVSYARQSFNDCVLEYNNAIETFPGNIVAGRKFKTRQGFEVTEASVRQAPQVKF